MDKIIDVIKKQGLAIVGLLIMGVYGYVSELVQKGRDVEINERIDTRFVENMENPAILLRVLQSQQVADFSKKASQQVQETIVKRVLKEDSLKTSMVDYLGQAVGMRNETVLPTLAKLLKAYEDGDIMTREEVEELLKRRNVRANF